MGWCRSVGGDVPNIPKTSINVIFGIFGIRGFDGGRVCRSLPPADVLNILKTLDNGNIGIFGIRGRRAWRHIPPTPPAVLHILKTTGEVAGYALPVSLMGGGPECPESHASIGNRDVRDMGNGCRWRRLARRDGGRASARAAQKPERWRCRRRRGRRTAAEVQGAEMLPQGGRVPRLSPLTPLPSSSSSPLSPSPAGRRTVPHGRRRCRWPPPSPSRSRTSISKRLPFVGRRFADWPGTMRSRSPPSPPSPVPEAVAAGRSRPQSRHNPRRARGRPRRPPVRLAADAPRRADAGDAGGVAVGACGGEAGRGSVDGLGTKVHKGTPFLGGRGRSRAEARPFREVPLGKNRCHSYW